MERLRAFNRSFTHNPTAPVPQPISRSVSPHSHSPQRPKAQEIHTSAQTIHTLNQCHSTIQQCCVFRCHKPLLFLISCTMFKPCKIRRCKTRSTLPRLKIWGRPYTRNGGCERDYFGSYEISRAHDP